MLICEGRTFIAGADISEFGKPPKGASLFDVQDVMENSPKPVIAAIHGTALGGGLEVALCAHYRVAVPSARCGLPEVNLGLLPGAGGTQRLPRIVGPEAALDMVTSGKHMGAKKCLEVGLVDALAPEDGLRATAIEFAKSVRGRKQAAQEGAREQRQGGSRARQARDLRRFPQEAMRASSAASWRRNTISAASRRP